jgi:hypothetical protein
MWNLYSRHAVNTTHYLSTVLCVSAYSLCKQESLKILQKRQRVSRAATLFHYSAGHGLILVNPIMKHINSACYPLCCGLGLLTCSANGEFYLFMSYLKMHSVTQAT